MGKGGGLTPSESAPGPSQAAGTRGRLAHACRVAEWMGARTEEETHAFLDFGRQQGGQKEGKMHVVFAFRKFSSNQGEHKKRLLKNFILYTKLKNFIPTSIIRWYLKIN